MHILIQLCWVLMSLMMSFDEFWWVSMSFDEFWWVLMSFDEFQWVLMSFDELWWVLISSVGFWWDLMTSDRFWWTLMSFNAQSKLYIYKTRHSRTPKWPITSPIQPKSNFLFHKKSPLQDKGSCKKQPNLRWASLYAPHLHAIDWKWLVVLMNILNVPSLASNSSKKLKNLWGWNEFINTQWSKRPLC